MRREPNLQSLISNLKSGTLSLLDYLADLEARFAEWEPRIHAFVPEEGRFARLRREAEALLARFPDPASRPGLFGVPVGVKDIFHVDGFVTRAGTTLPPEMFQGEEAPSVTRLRQAGALIAGKTVTTEFAYFGPGPTRNPHNLAHTPGGSSSGSAAAVAAGLCPLALGTQTIGSINRPAGFCGVVGFKPGYGRVPTAGVIPLAPALDHVGFFTPDVAGVEAGGALLCDDWQPVGAARRPVLGVPEGPYLAQASPEALAHFHDTCERLALAGYSVETVAAMPDFAEIRQRHQDLVDGEMARVHAEWFAAYGERYQPQTREHFLRGKELDERSLARARPGRDRLRQQLTALMDEHGLDLWLAPSAPGPAPAGLASTGDPVLNLPWTHAGLPTLTIPSGVNDAGLPLGLQLAGRWRGDEALVAWSAGIEAVVSDP